MSSQLRAQLVSGLQRADTLQQQNNFVQFGSTKLSSTFLFQADADLQQQLRSGVWSLRQQYRGSTIRTSSSTFRDDENFNFSYRSFAFQNFQPAMQSDVQVSRDSRAIGLSSLTKYNLSLGGRLVADSSRWLEVQAGAESNKLLGVQDVGSLLRLNALANNLELEQFRLLSRLRSEFAIFPRRTNGDFDFSLGLQRDFDAHNAMHINVSYRTLNRDWYSQLNTDTAQTMAIESRLEQRLTMDADLLFGITNNLNAEVQMGFVQSDIGRSFKDLVAGAVSTAASREMNEIAFNLNAILQWRLAHQRHELSIAALSRNEQNTADRHFDVLSAAQLDTLQQQERIRDNAMTRTQLSLRSQWELSLRDTINLNCSSSILRYDTPSNSNDDDRDELSDLLSLSYGHRVHESLRFAISSRMQLNHLVYLKAQRSALNFWNRIIQLSPSMEWHSPYISIYPTFEVLAQYAVYDFEGKAGVPSSFSFRQISYRDSVAVPLGSSTYMDARLYFRHFERGELYWGSFAELPQSRNYEQFVKLLMNFQPEREITVSAGARWYALSQENLLQRDVANTLSQSVGPECMLTLVYNHDTRLVFNAWYEFQYLNRLHTHNVPNMILSLRKNL